MLCASRIRRLPFEILKQVFQNLEKEDRKTCLLVCRSWNSAAHEYFSRDISIKVKERKLNIDDLLDDVLYFGQNVKAIKLNNSKYIQVLMKTIILNGDVFSACVPISLRTAFLKALQDPDIRLNDLQKLDINNLILLSPEIHDLYLRASIQYCQTITSLQLCALEEEHVPTKYGGLYKFISQFPRLTCLKVTWCPFDIELCGSLDNKLKSIVDLKNVLEEAPQLKEVNLYDCPVVTNDSPDIDAVQLIENRSLTDLKVFADNISIRTLRYIVSLLKEVEILALVIGNITMDKGVSVEESETILEDLEASTSEMKRVEIKYKCNGHDFYLNIGKEFKIRSSSNLFYRNESYFSSDDESDDDYIGDYSDDDYWKDCIDNDFFYVD
ncbi:hypothetical protein HPULCUR_000220 [Helicostylum pulchrum]|uniref:F-box domain-containing protein n=1 Tax=Helicostylum pulchrum TaxID=562976 RepID=A0ABP9XLD6_9FUNG